MTSSIEYLRESGEYRVHEAILQILLHHRITLDEFIAFVQRERGILLQNLANCKRPHWMFALLADTSLERISVQNTKSRNDVDLFDIMFELTNSDLADVTNCKPVLCKPPTIEHSPSKSSVAPADVTNTSTVQNSGSGTSYSSNTTMNTFDDSFNLSDVTNNQSQSSNKFSCSLLCNFDAIQRNIEPYVMSCKEIEAKLCEQVSKSDSISNQIQIFHKSQTPLSKYDSLEFLEFKVNPSKPKREGHNQNLNTTNPQTKKSTSEKTSTRKKPGSRRAPEYENLCVCFECGRRGQSIFDPKLCQRDGQIYEYFYCRNSQCPKGKSSSRYIGWRVRSS